MTVPSGEGIGTGVESSSATVAVAPVPVSSAAPRAAVTAMPAAARRRKG